MQIQLVQDDPGHDTVIQETEPPMDSDVPSRPTSNSLFVQQVASVLGSDFQHADKTGTGIGYSKACHSSADFNVKSVILPHRQLADRLLQCYWERFNPINPVLHQPTFSAAYTPLWEPAIHNQIQDVVFHSTLNVVFALGCQRYEALTVPERENLADEFYSRSVKLVSIDTLDTSSLQIVQLLLLRGFYLLCTPHADRCWATAGVALRVAQAIGLQSTKIIPVSTQLYREMRRRVWYNCFLLDW